MSHIISPSLKEVFKRIYESFPEWFDAVLEFLVVYITSNIPYIALVLIHILSTAGTTLDLVTVTGVISSNVVPGELFIYVSTLMAPFVYVMLQYVRALRHFPLYGLFLGITALVYLYCLIAFSMFKSGTIQNVPFMESVAPYFYLIALILWYFSLVYGRKLSKPEKGMGSNAQSIINQLGGGRLP